MGFKRPRVRISTLGPKKQKQYSLFLLFSFLERFEQFHANVRWTFARSRLDGNGSLISRISTLGLNSSYIGKASNPDTRLSIPHDK